VRVLHVYSGNLFGGIESILVSLARTGGTSDVAHEFALCFDARLAEQLRAGGAVVHLLAPVRVSRPQTIREARRRLESLLDAHRPDVCVLHASWSQALFAPVVRRQDVSLAFWAHDGWGGRHWTEVWTRRSAPDLVIANSAFTAHTLDGVFPGVMRAVIHAPLDVTPTAISPDERAAIRAELATPDSAVVCVQASRMEAWKGHATLLRTLAEIRDNLRWMCWIVGASQRASERTYEASLRTLASQLRISDRVRFAGERRDVRRVLAAADLYCQPNVRPEPFGIVFVEALLARLPVITALLGGASEIVDASCGVLVRVDDAHGWRTAIEHFVSDESARSRLAVAGPRRAVELCDPGRQMTRLRGALLAARQVSIDG
jgi:glycosyltransferase involved in cell wall biosynthesis